MKFYGHIFLFLLCSCPDRHHCLEEGPVFISEPPAKLFFPNSNGAVLPCVVIGHPEPSVTWLTAGDSRVIPVGGIREVSGEIGNSSLRLYPFRPEQYRQDIHVTTYRCRASNAVGAIVSRPVAVHAVVLQHFEVGISDTRGHVGGVTLFTCDVPPTVVRHVKVVRWTMDGRIIKPSLYPEGRFWAFPSGELVVRNLAQSDAYAHISCTAAHEFADTHTTSNIGRVIVTGDRLLSRPQLLLRREWLRPVEDTNLLLPCFASGYPLPTTSWYKEDETQGRALLNPRNPDRRIRIVEGQLIFDPVKLEDSGFYLCTANNSAGSDSYRVEISVRSPLHATVTPSAQRVDFGKPASLTCEISGHPVTSVLWYKDGKQLSQLPRITAYGKTLHISQVSRDDGGMYQCFARNEEDVVQAAAQVSLGDSIPVIEYRFISQTLQPGPSVSLKCVTTGAPSPRFTWKLDGFPLPQNDRIVVGQYVSAGGSVVSHVNISDVRPEDGGSYSCMAENRAGNSIHSARLNVYGPAYVRPMPVVTAVAGESMFLSCPASGYPLAKITWERDGRLLPLTARQMVHENGTLVVMKVQKSMDGGRYTCAAHDKQGRMHSSTATVQVLVPPKLSRFTFRDDLALGDRVSVQCAVNRGDTPLIVAWEKNGMRVESVKGITVRQLDAFTSMLSIERLGPEHTGNYTCTVSNDAATVSHTAALHVNVPPTITPFYFGEASAGERIQVVCSIRKGDPPFTINWVKDGVPLAEGPREGVQIRPMDQYTNSLLLEHVEERHSGNYTCLATNAAQTASHSASLSVKVPPSWTVSPSDTSAILGEGAEIPCKARGFPEPKITWRKAIATQPGHYAPVLSVRETSLTIRPYGASGPVVAPNGSLLVRGTSELDEGQYLCEAANGVGGGLSALITLSVHAPPQFDKIFNQQISVRRGSSTTLECQAKGDPPLRMEWRKDSQPLRSTSIIREITGGIQGEFTVSSALTKDAGTYSCLAENEYGRDTYEISLIVQDVPRAPYGLRVDERNSRSVIVSWLLPSQLEAGPVDKYIVQYREAEGGTWDTVEEKELLLRGEPTFHIRDLVPSTSYLVRILAKNHLGTSLPSEALQVTTKGEPPSAAPAVVHAEALTSTSVRVSWNPPPVISHHGALLGYNIGVKSQRLDSSNNYNFTVVDASSRQEIIERLQPWSHYSVVVRAYNSQGSGPLSPPVIVQTLQDVPSEPPTDVDCSGSTTANTLRLRWLAPPQAAMNGILQGYRLTLTQISDEDDLLNETTRTTTTTTELVTGLNPWTNYSVNVAAVTHAGIGTTSSEIICTTREDIPGPPRLRALQSGKDSIVLTWLPPEPPTGVLLGYTVHHRGPHDQTTQQYPLPPYTTSFTAKRLTVGSHKFWINARSQTGEGKSSTTFKITLVNKAPTGIASWGRRVVSQQGEDIRLECLVVGYESPLPVWIKDGHRIESEHRISLEDDGSLMIRKVEKADSGNYSCQLDVITGNDVNFAHTFTSITYHVMIQVPPSAPTVHISDTTASSFEVRWTAGDSGGASIRSWNIWWRLVSGSGTWNAKELGRTHTRYTIRDLECGSDYQVYVTAKTKVGLSPPSKPVNIRTRGGAPIAPPSHQTASTNSSNIRVWMGRWADGGCPISHFTLEIRHAGEHSWTTLASNLAPQDTYDFSHRGNSEVGLRLTAHNVAGSSTVTIHVGGPDGARVVENDTHGEGLSPLFFKDPRMLASAAASALAFILTVAAFILCVRRKALAERVSSKDQNQDDQEVTDTKINLLKQRESYATIIKQHPLPGLDRIPEYSEDIYPYATFQMGEGRGLQDSNDSSTTKFQTFVYQDSKYGITEARPPISSNCSRKGDYAKVGVVRGPGRNRRQRNGIRSESEEYDSDSETDVKTSSRTESSNQLDCTTIASDVQHIMSLESSRLGSLRIKDSDPQRMQDMTKLHGINYPMDLRHDKNVHHNLIYHTTESSCTSTEASPTAEHKSLTQRGNIKHMLPKTFDQLRQEQIQETSLTFPQKRDKVAVGERIMKKSKNRYGKGLSPSESEEGSLKSPEDQKESKKKMADNGNKPKLGFAGQISSHFRLYSSHKDPKGYIIKV